MGCDPVLLCELVCCGSRGSYNWQSFAGYDRLFTCRAGEQTLFADVANIMVLFPFEHKLSSGIVLRGWQTENRGRPLIFFLHGNGFCGRTYEPMLTIAAEQYDLLLLDIAGRGNSDACEAFPGWNVTASQCLEVIRGNGPLIDGRPLLAAGHSLGGVLSVLMMASDTNVFRRAVLLDPILFPGRMLMMFRLFAATGLLKRFHPLVGPTLRRRRLWDSKQQATEYLSQRPVFANWCDPALRGYIEYGLRHDADGSCRLRCDPVLEADIFGTWPSGLWRSIAAVNTPTTIIMGERTFGFARKAAQTAAEKNRCITMQSVSGDHCFMQENPNKAADLLTAALLEG